MKSLAFFISLPIIYLPTISFLTLSFSLILFYSSVSAKSNDFDKLCANQIPLQTIEKKYHKTRINVPLQIAEKLYGKRDKTWRVVGVDYTEAEKPRLWYPCRNQKYVVALLSRDALKDKNKSFAQLAQIGFYLLSPDNRKTGHTILEEGLATQLAIATLKSFTKKSAKRIPPNAIHKDSMYAYYQLGTIKSLYPDMTQRIRKLRAHGIKLSQLTPAKLKQHFPKLNNVQSMILTRVTSSGKKYATTDKKPITPKQASKPTIKKTTTKKKQTATKAKMPKIHLQVSPTGKMHSGTW